MPARSAFLQRLTPVARDVWCGSQVRAEDRPETDPLSDLRSGQIHPQLDRRPDLTAQRDGLIALGVSADRTYVDHGLTGTNRERPGLREAARRLPRR